MAPRFSVLLPTHNRADVVVHAIRSVLAQTEGDFELLIVGDGCTDGTADEVAAFDDPRIRWFDLPKAPGFGYANRNIALRQARGELVAFMAHDDLWLPDHLALMARALDGSGAPWGYSRPLWAQPPGVIVPFAFDLNDPQALHFFLNISNKIPAPCVVHRRSCFEKAGFWPEDAPQSGDWRLWRDILRSHDERFVYCPIPTTLHFRASWRTDANAGPPELAVLLEIAAAPGWPEALRIPERAGWSPQAVVADLIAEQGRDYVRALRDACITAVDRLAWDRLQPQPERAPGPAPVPVTAIMPEPVAPPSPRPKEVGWRRWRKRREWRRAFLRSSRA